MPVVPRPSHENDGSGLGVHCETPYDAVCASGRFGSANPLFDQDPPGPLGSVPHPNTSFPTPPHAMSRYLFLPPNLQRNYNHIGVRGFNTLGPPNVIDFIDVFCLIGDFPQHHPQHRNWSGMA